MKNLVEQQMIWVLINSNTVSLEGNNEYVFFFLLQHLEISTYYSNKNYQINILNFPPQSIRQWIHGLWSCLWHQRAPGDSRRDLLHRFVRPLFLFLHDQHPLSLGGHSVGHLGHGHCFGMDHRNFNVRIGQCSG